MQRVAVVGGGVVGLSLAYELARRGWKVALFDQQEPGREASWAGAGILPPANFSTALHPLDQLRGLSIVLHAEWAARLRADTGIDTGYRRCGAIYVARSPGEAAALHGMAQLHAEEQIETLRLTRQQLAELEPAMSEPALAGLFSAIYRVPDEAQLRNPWHLRALIDACRQLAVEIHPATPIDSFDSADAIHAVDAADAAIAAKEQGSGRVTAVCSGGRRFPVDAVCLTSGAWTQQLLRRLGPAVGILPIRGQMVLFKTAVPPVRHVLNDGPRYVVPREDGRVLAGSTEEDVGFDKSNTAAGVAQLTSLACELVPALRDAEIEKTWAGLRPGTYDGFPYIGRVPGFENAYVAAGHFRSGLYLSPATAVVVADLMSGRAPEIDLSPFRVARG